MDYSKLRLQKRAILDESITIPIDRETKMRLLEIRSKHNANHLEWVRSLIWEELPELEKAYPIQAKKQIGA